jgi:hypothetical protein
MRNKNSARPAAPCRGGAGRQQASVDDLRDGKQKTVEASIGAMPRNLAFEERKPAQPGGGKTANALGMELLPFDLQLRRESKVQ